MARRIDSSEIMAVEDALEYYETSRDSMIQAAEHARQSVAAGAPDRSSRFFAMTGEEVEKSLDSILEEADRQGCFFLIASAEAALRVDFLQKVHDRKKDGVSRAFRRIYKTKSHSDRHKVRLEEDILETWSRQVPDSKSGVSVLRGALNYRHWLAHGRYWTPKLGQHYDPTTLSMKIIDLFNTIGLPTI